MYINFIQIFRRLVLKLEVLKKPYSQFKFYKAIVRAFRSFKYLSKSSKNGLATNEFRKRL